MDRQCALIAAVGSEADCHGADCAFWDRGGAVVSAGCAVERLGIDLSNADLAHYLLDLRRAVEGARDEQSAAAARRGLSELVNGSDEY